MCVVCSVVCDAGRRDAQCDEERVPGVVRPCVWRLPGRALWRGKGRSFVMYLLHSRNIYVFVSEPDN